MSSSAISAQGSQFFIGSGTSGAKTITAITQAYRAQVSSTAHALALGDRVTFDSVVGMTEINSEVGTVIDVDTDTFCVDIDSRAFTAYSSAGTATPVTWVQVKEIKTYSGFDGERSEHDVSNLDSTAKEFRLGLKDNGTFSANISVVHSDAGQTACQTAHGSDSVSNFKLVLPNAEVGTFSGQVKSMPESGGVDAIIEGSINIRVSGDVTWA
jgi:hypothetical protein